MAELLCDLFYYSPEVLYTDSMFEEIWNYDKTQFITVIFYLRRHRKDSSTIRGRGQRKIFYQVLIWMSHHKLSELIILIPHIPDLGYWKDLLVLMGTPCENVVISLFSTQLLKDYESFNNPIPGLISLAAKWTPNEGSSSDRKHDTNKKIAKSMGISRKILRTKYLVPLRKYLSITEQIITDKKWSSVNYNQVPQLSLKLHSNTFRKNDGPRFNEYLNQSHNKQLIPHNQNSNVTDETTSFIFAIDISGSMSGFPMTIATSLCRENNVQTWIPFKFEGSDNVNVVDVLYEPVDKISDVITTGTNGYNMQTCIEAGEKAGKTHIIFINNTLLDISEIPIDRPIHVTYWSLTMNSPIITNDTNLTIIEGYDIQIYNKLPNVVTRSSYKDTIINILREENIIPVI